MALNKSVRQWMRIFQVFLILVLSACSQPASPEPITREPLPGASACGDGVCDMLEAENPMLCPRDCAPPPAATTSALKSTNTFDRLHFARITSQITVTRQAGKGNCGISPWRLPDCQEPHYWWGMQLEAQVSALAMLIPKGGGEWTISNQPDVLASQGISLTEFPMSAGRYTQALIDFAEDAQRCTGSLDGQPFDMQVAGDYSADQIHLLMTSSPTEKAAGQCAGVAFERTEWNLRSGWAAALSGDPHDLIAVFSEEDDAAQTGIYRRDYAVKTNPSAENRDAVSAVVTLECLAGASPDSLSPEKCPWETSQ